MHTLDISVAGIGLQAKLNIFFKSFVDYFLVGILDYTDIKPENVENRDTLV